MMYYYEIRIQGTLVSYGYEKTIGRVVATVAGYHHLPIKQLTTRWHKDWNR